MKHIKFRYWNGTKVLSQEAIINHLNKYIVRKDNNLMQYTGLLDKNGVDIYEGDLLEIRLNSEEIPIGEVVFDRGSFNVRLENGNGYMVSYIKHEAAVVGNIYETGALS